MNKRIIAVVAALMILMAAVWPPALRVHAEGLETDSTETEFEPEDGAPEIELQPFDLGGGGLGDGSEDVEENDIFRFAWEDDICFLALGAPLSELQLPATAKGYINAWQYEDCPIDWHYEGVESSIPGRYLLTGEITLPEGYTTSLERTAQNPVIVYEPDGPPVVTAAWADRPLRNNTVQLGMNSGELAAFFTANDWGLPLKLLTEHGDTCYGELSGWDVSLVDTSVAGVYYPHAIEPPPGVGLPARGMLGAEFYVLAPDEVCLFAVDFDPYYGFLNVSWLKEINEPELWLSVDGGEWNRIYDEYSWRGSTGLELLLGNNNSPFQAGHKYEFQVRYENGGVSVDTLIVDFTSGKPIFIGIGGDRSGGDREENTLPLANIRNIIYTTPSVNPDDETPDPTPNNPGGGTSNQQQTDSGKDRTTTSVSNPGSATLTTPTPTVDPAAPSVVQQTAESLPAQAADPQLSDQESTNVPSANGASAPVTAATRTPQQAALSAAKPAEYADAESVTVSAERLAVMMDTNPEYVPFLLGELRVSLPTPYLESLGLSPADAITVALYQPDEHSFTISFATNGVELTNSFDEPFLVSLPWSGGPVSCTSESGETFDASLENGRAAFALYRAGTYTLTEQAIPVMSAEQTAPITEVVTSPQADPPADPLYPASPYSDGWMPVIVAGLVGLAGGGAFFGFRWKRAVRRP